MSETTWNMTNVNDTIVGEALQVSIPFEVKGFLVITLGKALKLSCDYNWQKKACNQWFTMVKEVGSRLRGLSPAARMWDHTTYF